MNIDIEEYNNHMFTTSNLLKYCKHIIKEDKNIILVAEKEKIKEKHRINNIQNKFYNPNQKDSLFWCFYILKYGYFNYEMEINGQYFSIEKKEKIKYVELLRNNKDKLKIHKIKPYSEIEDDLVNKDKISIKTFFALCIIENINSIIIDNHKIYEIICSDDKINVLIKDKLTNEYSIEIDASNEIIHNYRLTYYIMPTFDASLKSISSYKLDELIDLCIKLGISIENTGKKMCKKDYYELLISNY